MGVGVVDQSPDAARRDGIRRTTSVRVRLTLEIGLTQGATRSHRPHRAPLV